MDINTVVEIDRLGKYTVAGVPLQAIANARKIFLGIEESVHISSVGIYRQTGFEQGAFAGGRFSG
jgi:hypothetical protein